MQDRRSGSARVRVAEIVRTTSLVVSCVNCRSLHKPQYPLDLNPGCPGCTGKYTMTFAFAYAPYADAAFEHECRNYHHLGGSYGLDNERHPAPPEGVRCTEDRCT